MNHSFSAYREHSIENNILEIVRSISYKFCKEEPKGLQYASFSTGFKIATKDTADVGVEVIRTDCDLKEFKGFELFNGAVKYEEILGHPRSSETFEILQSYTACRLEHLTNPNSRSPVSEALSSAIADHHLPVSFNAMGQNTVVLIQSIAETFLMEFSKMIVASKRGTPAAGTATKEFNESYSCQFLTSIGRDFEGNYTMMMGACIAIDGYIFRVCLVKETTELFNNCNPLRYDKLQLKNGIDNGIAMFNALLTSDAVFANQLLSIPPMLGENWKDTTFKDHLAKVIEAVTVEVMGSIYRDTVTTKMSPEADKASSLIRYCCDCAVNQIAQVRAGIFFGKMTNKDRESVIYALQKYMHLSVGTAVSMVSANAIVNHFRDVQDVKALINKQNAERK